MRAATISREEETLNSKADERRRNPKFGDHENLKASEGRQLQARHYRRRRWVFAWISLKHLISGVRAKGWGWVKVRQREERLRLVWAIEREGEGGGWAIEWAWEMMSDCEGQLRVMGEVWERGVRERLRTMNFSGFLLQYLSPFFSFFHFLFIC